MSLHKRRHKDGVIVLKKCLMQMNLVGDNLQVLPTLCVEIHRKEPTLEDVSKNRFSVHGTHHSVAIGDSLTDTSNIIVTIRAGERFTTGPSQNTLKRSATRVMVHELCHAQQVYFTSTHNPFVPSNERLRYQWDGKTQVYSLWYNSEQAQEFIRIAGYVRDLNGVYQKPSRSNLPFHQYDYYGYKHNSIIARGPIEFSADVCKYFLLEQAGALADLEQSARVQAILNYEPLRNWFNEYVKANV